MTGTKKLVLLASSSPHRYTINTNLSPPTSHIPFVPDSDDSLPSASKFFRRPADARLKSGTRATHVPQDAIVGIQSVSALFRQNVLNVDQESPQEEFEKPPTKDAKKQRKPRTKKETGAAKKGSAKNKKDTEGKLKCQRKRKPKANDMDVQEEEAISTRDSIDSGTRCDDGESRKASKASRPRQKKTSTTSAHFTVDDKSKTDAIENDTVEQQAGTTSDVRFATAMKRRTSWTPPKDADLERALNPDMSIYDPFSSPNAASPTKRLDFTNLQQTFAYSPDPDSTSVNPIRKGPVSSAPNKRRRIEVLYL